MAEIKYIGVNKLDESEKATVDELSASYYEKIARVIGAGADVKLNVKTHEKAGERKKYAILLMACSGSKCFECHASDWDLARTLHKSFKEMENIIQHQFKTKGHPKGPSPRKG